MNVMRLEGASQLREPYLGLGNNSNPIKDCQFLY